MRRFRAKQIGWRTTTNFLREYFGKDGSHVWEGDKMVSAVFHHESFTSSKKSIHLVSVIFEYDYTSESGLFTIFASESKREGVSGSYVEGEVIELIKESMGEYDDPDLSKVMGNRRYCAKCEKWDDYDIKEGQLTVVCKSCGLKISLEEN